MPGTSYEIDLPVKGSAAVVSAAAALSGLSERMNVASAASVAASDAMKVGEAAYRQAEATADRAAKAVEKLGVAADAQRGKMAAAMDAGNDEAFWKAAAAAEKLSQRQGEAATKAAGAKSAMDTEAAALDKLRVAANAAAEGETKIKKAHEAATKAAEAESKAAKEAAGSGDAGKMEGAMAKLGGPLGRVGQLAFGGADALKKMRESLGSMGPYVAAAVVIATLAAGLVLATAAILSFAIGAADAARTSALLSAGIAHSVKGGKELDDTISDLGKRVPMTSEELQGMASSLAQTGLRGAALSKALEDAAVKASTLKYGPEFQKQTLSLSSQTARLKSNISDLFGGLDIEETLGGLSKIVAMFDSTSITGRAIKVVFESIFQPIIDSAAAMLPKVVSTFIQIEILMMKAAIAVKPYGSKLVFLAQTFGVLAALLVGVVAVAFGIVAGSVLFFLAPIIAAAAAIVWVTKLFMEFGPAITEGAGAALDWLGTAVDDAMAYLSGLSLSDIGIALMTGLADGITGAAGAIVKAIGGAVTGAIDSAKSLLGIHSPSKVFADIGAQTGAGMSAGVDGATAGVQGSMEALVAPPEVQASAGGGGSGGAGGSGGGGAGTSFSGAVFNFYGVAGAEDAESRFEALMTRLVEGDTTALGAGPVPS